MELEPITLLEGKRILLGVTGSIAAYKVVDLASKLTQVGALVDVIMTGAAQQFVTPLTFQAVTGRPVYTDLWRTESGGALPTHVAHVGLAEGADLLMVVPATADVVARLAHGMADDLLTVTALAARCPLLLAPAMDGTMYEHPAVQDNLALLVARGAHVIEPEIGRFASGLVGKGRLPETSALIGALRRVLGLRGALRGKHILVTAGGTREPLDPVRFITNRSSGKQGYALAQAALDAGAEVALVSAARTLPDPYGARVLHTETAEQMLNAVMKEIIGVDALIMAAAVADFRPRTVSDQKIKKDESSALLGLTLEKNPDILRTVRDFRKNEGRPRVVVGFAAESENLRENARAKLERKGLDLMVANDITAADAGFDAETNRVVIFDAHGDEYTLELMSKARVSEYIMRRVAQML